MLKNGFLNKMKGATVTNNRSRIALSLQPIKREALHAGNNRLWNLNINCWKQ
jgi:hypothetical protein